MPAQPASSFAVARFPQDRSGDAQLVRDVARGDREALGVVWDRYSKLVRGVLFGVLGSDHAAEDLLQDVFLAFYRGAGSVRSSGALRPYLVGVTVRLAALELRRRKIRRWVVLSRTGELPDFPVQPDDSEARESLRALYRVLDQLGDRRRLAFVLRHVHGLEILEVAAALDISEATARRELARSREQLAALARGEPSLARYLSLQSIAKGRDRWAEQVAKHDGSRSPSATQ
jgi:RNA polymerase sigma-70 factor (ECF subfamily)